MFMTPMLLQKEEQPFDDADYLFEPKIDGHRLILSHFNGITRLYTRHNNEITRQYPELHKVPVDADVVLDGEVACIHPETQAIDFESVIERFRMAQPARIRAAVASMPVHYFVFDILHLNGKDLRNLPLIERKAILNEVLTDNNYFSKLIHVQETGKQLFSAVKERSMEGIVAKQKDSIYVGRRSDCWKKIINYRYSDVYIAGYRKDQFGWLTQVDAGNGDMRPAGIIEFGVPSSHKKAFYGVSSSIVIGEDRSYVYVEPKIKARIKFRYWTKAGLLRKPQFIDFIE